MIKIYTEISKSKEVKINYNTDQVKVSCIVCDKKLGDTFEKREANYLVRGNFCTECAGVSQQRHDPVVRHQISGIHLLARPRGSAWFLKTKPPTKNRGFTVSV